MNQEPQKIKKTGYRVRMLTNTVSYILLILGISMMLSIVLLLTVNDAFALTKSGDTPITVVTDETLSLREMGKLLKENDVIEYPWAFSLFTKIKHSVPGEEDMGTVHKLFARLNQDMSFEAGSFDFLPTMDYGQIVSALRNDAVVSGTVRITFPEGYSIRQIAALLEENKVCSAKDFIDTCNSYNFSHEFLKDVPMVENRLEGYLYPDTYDFYLGESAVSAANRFLNNFNKRFTDAMRDLTAQSGRTIQEIITVASLVEKEAKLESERTRIAGVIYNRLEDEKNFPFLQIDATVAYATGREGPITKEDLSYPSRYNTYVVHGLPPTAICSPGISSMLAALQYEDNSYYYYVADPEDGSHLFARTLEQHNVNVAAMEKKAQQGGSVG